MKTSKEAIPASEMEVEQATRVVLEIGEGKVEDFVDLLQERGCISQELGKRLFNYGLRQYVRHILGTVKNKDGHRIFHHITTTNENGEKVPAYKQEALFDAPDYVEPITHHIAKSRHHAEVASRLLFNRSTRFPKAGQIDIPFDFEGVVKSFGLETSLRQVGKGESKDSPFSTTPTPQAQQVLRAHQMIREQVRAPYLS